MIKMTNIKYKEETLGSRDDLIDIIQLMIDEAKVKEYMYNNYNKTNLTTLNNTQLCEIWNALSPQVDGCAVNKFEVVGD